MLIGKISYESLYDILQDYFSLNKLKIPYQFVKAGLLCFQHALQKHIIRVNPI